MLDFTRYKMRLSAILIGLMIGAVLTLSCASTHAKIIEDVPAKDLVANIATSQRPAVIIRVPLPITLAASQQVQQA